MPSPIGHAMAGVAVAWITDFRNRRSSSARLVVACATLAIIPDLDLLVPQFHRSATHSVTAVVVILIFTATISGRWRVGSICALAYASHLLLDWLGTDNYAPGGIRLLWPFTTRIFKSGWDVFAQTERTPLFAWQTMRQNLRAVAQEVAILAPVVLAAWLVSVRTANRHRDGQC